MGEAKRKRTAEWRREQLLKEIDELYKYHREKIRKEKENESRTSERK